MTPTRIQTPLRSSSKPATQQRHREHEPLYAGFGVSPGADHARIGNILAHFTDVPAGPTIPFFVTRALSRNEMKEPKALKAILDEGRALIDVGTWDESTVIEKEKLLQKSKNSQQKIHYGDVLTLCSIKFAEMKEEHWKYKGRICFRGDNTKDEYGAPAVFQELSSSPTTVQTANANIAYGLFDGHRSTSSDAQRAYVQADLKSKYPTYVSIPKSRQRIGMGNTRSPCVAL